MGVYKDLNDYEIMYLVEENDDEANRLLFEKYHPVIFKMAIKYKNEAKKCGLELEDLIQEGYIGLYNASKTYNPSKDSLFYTYANISIRSKMLNVIRCNNTQRNNTLNNSLSLFDNFFNSNDSNLLEVLSDESAIDPEKLMIENEFNLLISDFMFSLDFNHALIFELRFNGFSNKDISVLMETSIKSITNIIFRINKKFKEYLSKNYHVTNY